MLGNAPLHLTGATPAPRPSLAHRFSGGPGPPLPPRPRGWKQGARRVMGHGRDILPLHCGRLPIGKGPSPVLPETGFATGPFLLVPPSFPLPARLAPGCTAVGTWTR